jgi:hypothetical protein
MNAADHVWTRVLCVTLGLLTFGLRPLSAEPDISLEQIRTYLVGKRSPLADHAATLLAEGRKWDVDPRLVIAISGQETSFGRRLCVQFNAWNWFWCLAQKAGCGDRGPCAGSPLDSWPHGITQINRQMKRYFDVGRTTIPSIRQVYCHENCEPWIRNVTRFYVTELHGIETDLRFHQRR